MDVSRLWRYEEWIRGLYLSIKEAKAVIVEDTIGEVVSEKTYYERQIEKIKAQSGLAEHYYIQIRHSKDFMEKCYSDKIELDKIAEAACMSRFHFIRLFQIVYGTTPRQYLRDVRIHKAKELIQKGKPVIQVCHEVGYDSLPTFSNAFKKGTGLSPREYQKLNFSNRE